MEMVRNMEREGGTLLRGFLLRGIHCRADALNNARVYLYSPQQLCHWMNGLIDGVTS